MLEIINAILGPMEKYRLNRINKENVDQKLLRSDVCMVSDDLSVGIESQSTLASHVGFGFTDVLFVKEKLSVQVADIDGVEVDLIIIKEITIN